MHDTIAHGDDEHHATFARLLAAIDRRARAAPYGTTFGLFIAVFALDASTPADVGARYLYAAPIALATVILGSEMGLLLATVGAVGSAWVGGPAYDRYPVPSHLGLAIALRFAFDVALVLVVGAVTRAHDRTRDLSERDPLTGLYNRRGFHARATIELQRARRYGRTLSLAYLDLDDFKKVNDEAGHSAGDRVLEIVGAALASGRALDVAARIGGDELVLLMPETTYDAAAVAIERLRQTVASRLARERFAVTFTTGLVSFDVCPDDVDVLLRAADGLLCEAKRARKDRRRGPSESGTQLRAVQAPRLMRAAR